jgi:hypothetical protein
MGEMGGMRSESMTMRKMFTREKMLKSVRVEEEEEEGWESGREGGMRAREHKIIC